MTAAYRHELRRTLDCSPLRYGYAFTEWSIARLNRHLSQRTGVRLSDDWLRQLANDEGFVVGRPKHTLQNKRAPKACRRQAGM